MFDLVFIFHIKDFFFKCLDPCLSIFIYEGDIKAPIESTGQLNHANWWMNNKIQYSHRIEYHSTVKRVHATTWMSLENIMLKSERSQLHKITYCVSPFIWRVQSRQICRDRTNWWLLRTGRSRGWLLKDRRFFIGRMKMF